MSPPYQSTLFESSLPRWLACSDDPQEWGIQRLPREKALKRAYVDPNPSALVWAMVFDIDRRGAATAWEDAHAPRPNWIAQNPRNGHAHLGYMLAAPVSRTLKARGTPQRFLARIQHGLTGLLDADRAYTHHLTKTPDHPKWRTFWERSDPYELTELRDYLGERLPLRIPRAEAVGEGRNITIFDALRFWAYRARPDYNDPYFWEAECVAHALMLNTFTAPLGDREVRQVAKSVAKWSWENISASEFSAIQAARGTRGARKTNAIKQARAMDTTQRLLELNR